MKMRGKREAVINSEDHSGSSGGHTDVMKRVILEILRMRLLLRKNKEMTVLLEML